MSGSRARVSPCPHATSSSHQRRQGFSWTIQDHARSHRARTNRSTHDWQCLVLIQGGSISLPVGVPFRPLVAIDPSTAAVDEGQSRSIGTDFGGELLDGFKDSWTEMFQWSSRCVYDDVCICDLGYPGSWVDGVSDHWSYYARIESSPVMSIPLQVTLW